MDSGLFEGYIGIRLGDGQLISDIIFSLLFVLLFLFALCFRFYGPYFSRQIDAIRTTKEHQRLFDDSGVTDIYPRCFMIFQTLFLCSIFLFTFLYSEGRITVPNIKTTFILLGLFFCALFLFYQYKQAMNFLLGLVFTDSNQYAFWKKCYNALFGLWGTSLYLPTLWLLFFGNTVITPAGIFLFFYILYRIVLIYKSIRIFYTRKADLLYLCLYLCAQELLPVVFLYEGLIYLYNIIETSTLWH